MSFLDSLNEAQKEAVCHTEGPVMVIAGAGSGKTRVLTYRIAYLIQEKRVDPFHILALTFTNKAASEMRRRIEAIVGTEAKNIWMGTFHSVFARILRVEAAKIGYPYNFTIYDMEDSKSLIKSIVKELNLDDKVYKPSSVLARISGAKNALISVDDYLANPSFLADDQTAMRPEIGKIYKIYQERCFKSGAMDFDDILFNTHLLFKNHIDVLNKYQHIFQYVLVDEFQDTNISQYTITKKLAARHQNICVVGDDAQSIYAFRGADIQNILHFERDYPDLYITKLEQNYRSTKTIVKAANSVIDKNKGQLKKVIWTDNPAGDPIQVIRATSDNEEGRLVVHSIFESKVNRQLQNHDFAILYRTNYQSRSFEEALRRANISYKVVGGLSFYQRKEIKDILAYIRFTLNPNDEESFKRIINLPKRGIGDTTIDKIRVAAYEQGMSLWDVLVNSSHFVSPRAAEAIQAFVVLIKNFTITAQEKNAFDAATYIAKHSGLLKELYDDKTVEGLSRYENVHELLNAIKEFVDQPDIADLSLGAFLQEVSLLTDMLDDDKNQESRVTLMTVHAAKGLEFKQVYIVGLEEDLFPSQMMLSSRADLEEERRLFYVAMTRAQENLNLSYALTRYRFGRLFNCDPSRFLSEIDPTCLQQSVSKSSFIQSSSSNGFSKNLISKKKVITTYVPSPNFQPSDISQLVVGMRVEHQKFGFGIVKEMDVNSSDKKAKIFFDDHGEKLLLLSFAKLKIC